MPNDARQPNRPTRDPRRTRHDDSNFPELLRAEPWDEPTESAPKKKTRKK